MPHITVIVLLQDNAESISNIAQTLRAQTFKFFECILLDNCPSDITVKSAKLAICNDTRFRRVRTPKKMSEGAARNIGLLNASGEYVIFLESNEVLSPTCLEDRYTSMKCTPFSECVAGSYSQVGFVNDSFRKLPSSLTVDIYSSPKLVVKPFIMPSVMISRDIAMKVGGFNQSLTNILAVDLDFISRVLRHGFILLSTDKVDYFYLDTFKSDESSPNNNFLDIIFDKNNRYEKESNFFSVAINPLCFPSQEYALELQKFNKIFFPLRSDFLPTTHGAKKYLHFSDVFFLSSMQQGMTQENLERTHAHTLSPNHRNSDLASTTDIVRSKPIVEREIDFDNIIYSPEWQRKVDIIFTPERDYHAVTIKNIAPYLEKEGITFVVADISDFQESIEKDVSALSVLLESNIPYVSLSQIALGDFAPKCIASFTDWTRFASFPAINEAKKLGIVALCIGEGIHDYDNVDIGFERDHYKRCSHMITPCPFDVKYFDKNKQFVYSGAMPRIDSLIKESEEHPYIEKKTIVINSNFSYGVLVDKHQSFIKDAVDACSELNYPYIITQHPADIEDLSGYNVSSKSMYDTIWDGSLFISRFGSGLIESLAMNRPVIYFNPHGEKIDKFKNPNGAYYIANNKEELKRAIEDTYKNLDILKMNWRSFLELHAGYTGEKDTAACKVANAIIAALNSITIPSEDERRSFGVNFAKIFRVSNKDLFKRIRSKKTVQFINFFKKYFRGKKYYNLIK